MGWGRIGAHGVLRLGGCGGAGDVNGLPKAYRHGPRGYSSRHSRPRKPPWPRQGPRVLVG
jgi:hypothetical protein